MIHMMQTKWAPKHTFLFHAIAFATLQPAIGQQDLTATNRIKCVCVCVNVCLCIA